MAPSSAARARPVPVLILSAFEPELAPLRAWLAGPERRSLLARVACAPAGIGAVEAAAGAAAAIARLRPRLVLFVGTAGSYGKTPPLGAVAVARRVRLASAAVARGEAYLPAPMRRELDTDPALRQALRRAAGAPLADVATTVGITRGRALAARLAAATGCAAENLEVFAVASAAAGAGARFGAVLGIANRVGPAAHRQWLANQARATEAACAAIAAWLAAGPV